VTGAVTGAVVQVQELRVDLAGSPLDIVQGISFEIAAGEVVGLVGESGSGKTTVGLALLGHCRHGAAITAGKVLIGGADVLQATAPQLRALRGRTVAYVPQDPGTALNPALRVGEQIDEMLRVHLPALNTQQRADRVEELLQEVRMPPGNATLRRYPHQFSGGQQQRIALGMAFACRPRLIVLDEPTTGLDVTTQAHVLETVRNLCARHGVAALYVSHDLAVVAGLADRVVVLYAGRIVEAGRSAPVFAAPAHPYTERLLRAVPDPAGQRGVTGIPGHAPSPFSRPAGCAFAPRCDRASDVCRQTAPPLEMREDGHRVACWHAGATGAFTAAATLRRAAALRPALLVLRGLDASYGPAKVLHGIDLEIRQGECLALLGESGSGKTTLARCIAGLHPWHSVPIGLQGQPLPRAVRDRSQAARQAIQYVFQNPYASLNPRRTIGEIVARPLHVFFRLSANETARKVGAHLERVALSTAMAQRYPDQLSGGERQRVAVARALAAEPLLLVCDEITSALDVSVQAAIMELLVGLRQDTGLSMLYVTHNLPLVRGVSDRVAVMHGGRIVEVGPTAEVFDAPHAGYTRELMANTPGFRPHSASAPRSAGLTS